ncbi:MAG: DUF1902 domain-containing protein [Defluviitaleaceae bacterium]|nr:DUF1902 domain-containing protein [Defluviitaleaceae bacterium]
MKTCKIKMIWDDGVWIAESEDNLGIVLESSSFDNLVERVRDAIPEMLELNLDYTGDFQIHFEAERLVIETAAV